MDLFEEFQALVPAASSTDFAAASVGTRRNDFVAKRPDGAPVFLISDSSAAAYTPGTTLKHLSVQFHATCQVQSPAGSFDGQFALIACDASVPELYELFIRCVGAAIEQLPDTAETKDIESCVRSLLNLFRAMNSPGGREIAGLWAELFVITQAVNTSAAVRAWRADTYERFDFSWPGGVLEVKATQGAVRVHEFSLEQLTAPSGRLGMVASLLLQPLTNGCGILTLAGQIDAALTGHGDLRERLWRNITSALGKDFDDKLDRKFDVAFAKRHLKLFNMYDIPSPAPPEDQRITSVRFRVEIGTVVTTAKGEPLKALKSLLPQDFSNHDR